MDVQGLNIDLTDPRVRSMLTPDGESALAPKKREVVQLAGDVPDPTGFDPNRRGIMSTHHLNTAKVEVLVPYRGRHGEFDLTVDVYAIPGQPIELHLICPKCRHASRITGERKKIEFDPRDQRPVTLMSGRKLPSGGRLDVEPFECSWEMPEAGAHTPGIRAGGMTLCRMRLAIDGSVAKDA